MDSTITAPPIVEALRQVADLLEQHPDLPQPYVTSSYAGRVDARWYLSIDSPGAPAEQRATAQQIIRAIGGHWDKDIRDDEVRFTAKLGLLDLDVQVVREAVCTRRVVGTEEVTIPAVEARPERTEVREVVEWDCQPILADEQVSA